MRLRERIFRSVSLGTAWPDCRGKIRLLQTLLIFVMMISAICAAASRPAFASEVKVPLTIDYLAIREALRRDLYTAPGNRAALWNGADDCQFLYAENPEFGRALDTVKLETAASLGLGVQFGGNCVSPIAWSGIAEALGAPYFAPGLKLKFHFTDLNLYDSKHQKTMVVSRGFDLVKQYLIPRLEAFSYDLNPAVNQLAMLASDAAAPEVAGRIRSALATIRAEPQIAVLDDGIRVTLLITVPDFPTPTVVPGGSPTPAQLTPAELKAFQTALDQWDAFLVFTIKQLGENTGDTVTDKQFRDDLMKLLLDSRFRLVQALKNPSENAGPDPVRIIFLDEWRNLHDIVKSAAHRGLLGARALEFLSFISAGDALFALDQAAPALGMRISAQDLRRLAHIMAPKVSGDPLLFNYDEDPRLKKMLGVPEPPRIGAPLDEPDANDEPTPSGSSATPAPTPTPARSSPTAFLFHWLDLFSPAEADAAESAALMPRLEDVAKRLHRVVVNAENALRYRSDMDNLLELSAERQLAGGGFDDGYRAMYPVLVKAAAWQESCWRQFVMAGAKLRWLESSTGDIGLMQVNKHVWRGLYNIRRLEWDVLYNAGAGTEILARSIANVSSRAKQDPVPMFDHLARSAYAAYNGGPDAYNRWRLREPEPLRQIDNSFWDKYRAIKNGQSFDILSCAASWGHAPAKEN